MFQRYPLVCGLLAFATGIICSAVPAMPLNLEALPVPLCHGLLPLALAIPALAYTRKHRIDSRTFPRPVLLVFLILAAVAGLLEGTKAVSLYRPGSPGFPAQPPDEPAWFTGTVSRRPVSRFRDTAVIVDLEQSEIAGRTIPCHNRIRLTFPTPAEPTGQSVILLPVKGQKIRFFSWLRRPVPFDNPGRFDYLRHLAAHGVSHTARLKSVLLIQPLAPPRPVATVSVCRWVDRTVRARFGCRRTGGLMAPGAMLVACLTGNRRWIDPDDEELLRCSGLGHLLAISGLHLGLLGFILSFLLFRFQAPIRFRRLALITFFVFYLQLAGGTPSITRAVITAVVFLSGRILGYRPVVGNSLAAAGLSILAFNPLILHDAGFQLTFGASYSILILAPMFTAAGNSRAQRMSSAVSLPRGLLAVSAAVFFGIAPLQAALFHRATPAALLTNLAAGPLLGLSLAAGLLMLAAESLSDLLPPVSYTLLQTISGSSADLVEFGFLSILALAKHSAPYSFRLPSPTPPACAAYYLCLGAAVLISRRSGTERRGRSVLLLTLCAPCLLLFSACLGGRWLPDRTIRVTFLDVGQGDSAIVELSSRRALVIDGGGALPGGFDFGERVVSPALWRLGRHQLEAVAVSHGHQDHAGGLASVVRNFRPRAILAGRRLVKHMPSVRGLLQIGGHQGAALMMLSRGRVVRCGDSEIIVLHPPPIQCGPHGDQKNRIEEGMGPNNDSLVLLLRHGGVKILFTGDLESDGEDVLLSSPMSRLITDCDLLKVGHHGAADASSDRWLRHVSPQTSVITAGRRNRFGHPDPALFHRLRDAGCRRIHCTGLDGALTVVSDGRRLYHRTGRR